MSMFGNLTAGYICDEIDAKIKEIKASDTISPKAKINVIHGLELAKEIASKYED